MGINAEFKYKVLKGLAKKIFYSKFNVVEGEYVLPEEGQAFILVGHHVSAFDPIIINAFSKRLIRFLYADANDHLKGRSFILKQMDMIPFSKNSADFKSIRQIKKRLKEGQAIGLYPEGGATWDGLTEPVIFSTSKLLKMMDVPVYGVSYHGGYLSKPRWCKETRKGKVRMDTYQMFTREELKTLTVEDIHERLTKSIYYNEFEWQKKARIPFKGKNLAESIEKLLYYCPECQKFNVMTSKGDHFHCKSCGISFTYDVYGDIKTDGHLYEYQIPSWNDHQRKIMKNRLAAKESIEGFPMEVTHMKVVSGAKAMEGIWTFDPYELRHDASNRAIRLSDVKNYSITFNRVIRFSYENIDYHLELMDGSNLSIKMLYDCITLLKEA